MKSASTVTDYSTVKLQWRTMPGWRSLYPLTPFYNNNNSNSIMAEDVDMMGEEEKRIAYDMAEMERVFRISQLPTTGIRNRECRLCFFTVTEVCDLQV